MEDNMEYREQLVRQYKDETMSLLRYLPWFEKNSGKSVSSSYENSELDGNTISFPVYDQTLMNFVKEASKSNLMDKNYRYVYTRHRLNSHDDERKAIKNATINDWDLLCGILSRYVYGGYTKGVLWNEASKESIFYLVLKQMKEILEFWDKPIDVR